MKYHLNCKIIKTKLTWHISFVIILQIFNITNNPVFTDKDNIATCKMVFRRDSFVHYLSYVAHIIIIKILLIINNLSVYTENMKQKIFKLVFK